MNIKRDKIRKEKFKLSTKLFLSYTVLIIFIMMVGSLAYVIASKAITKSFKESAEESVNMLGEYIEYGLDTVMTEVSTYLLDDELGFYVDGKITGGDLLSYYSKQKTNVTNKASVNSFISNIYIVSDKASSISTGKKSVDNAYSAFLKDEKCSAFSSEPNKFHWFGKLESFDSLMGIDSQSYALRVTKGFYKKNAAVIMDIDSSCITDILVKLNYGKNCYVAFVTDDGKEICQDGIVTNSNQILGAKNCLLLSRKIGDTNAVVYLQIPNSVLQSRVDDVKNVTIILVLVACLLSVIISVVISSGVKKSVKYMTDKIQVISEGDLKVRFMIQGKSEFADISSRLNQMLEGVSTLIIRAKEVNGKVTDSVQNLNKSSNSIKESSSYISVVMSELENGMTNQAEDTIASYEELEALAESIEKVADETLEISEIALVTEKHLVDNNEAIDELSIRAKETSTIMFEIIHAIDDLEKQTKQIEEIINVVYEIADETSLLSLNASIESARAGANGKGFQVIAEEIRKLAEESKESTEKISQIIAETSHTAQHATKTAMDARQTIERQEGAVGAVYKSFEEMKLKLESLIRIVSEVTGNVSVMGDKKGETVKNMESISSVTQEAVSSVTLVNESVSRQNEEVINLTTISAEMQEHIIELEKAMEQFII